MYDHFMGMLGQVAQFWAMRKFNIDPQTMMPRQIAEPEEMMEQFMD